MCRGNASAGHEKIIDLCRKKSAERDIASAVFRRIAHSRITRVFTEFNRPCGTANGIAEFGAANNIRASELIPAQHAAAFPHANSRRERGDPAFFKTRQRSPKIVLQLEGQFLSENLKPRQALGIERAVMVTLGIEVDRDPDLSWHDRGAHDGSREARVKVTVADSTDHFSGKLEARIVVGRICRDIDDGKNIGWSLEYSARCGLACSSSEERQMRIAGGIDEGRGEDGFGLCAGPDPIDVGVATAHFKQVCVAGEFQIFFPPADVEAEFRKRSRLLQEHIQTVHSHRAGRRTEFAQAVCELHRKAAVRRPRDRIRADEIKPADTVHESPCDISSRRPIALDQQSFQAFPRTGNRRRHASRAGASHNNIEMVVGIRGVFFFQNR